MSNEWRPGLPNDFTITARFEVDGQQYEYSKTVTREFLTDAQAAGNYIVAVFDDAAGNANRRRAVPPQTDVPWIALD